MKPSLSWDEQVSLLIRRSLGIEDGRECAGFLSVHNYYRFSGYMRYFQIAPHHGADDFVLGTTLNQIWALYDADQVPRSALPQQLTNSRTAPSHPHGTCHRQRPWAMRALLAGRVLLGCQ